MDINDLLISNKEMPIHYDSKGYYHTFYVLIPNSIYENFNKKNTYDLAELAIRKSVNETLEIAIAEEFDRLIDYETTISQYCKELIKSNSLDKCAKNESFTDSKNNLKFELLKHYKLYNESNKILDGKMPQAQYLCSRANEAIINDDKLKDDDKLKHFKELKKSLLGVFKRQKNEERIESIIRYSSLSSGRGLPSFSVPGNGIAINPAKSFSISYDFSMPEEKFNELTNNESKKFNYVSHNVDTLFDAILLRDIVVNYLNLLAEKMLE